LVELNLDVRVWSPQHTFRRTPQVPYYSKTKAEVQVREGGFVENFTFFVNFGIDIAGHTCLKKVETAV
jgi:hypothetical protein